MHPQLLLEYALNALWQVPLVAGAAWLFRHAARLGPRGEHRLWLAVLAACVLLPIRGIHSKSSNAPKAPNPAPSANALPLLPADAATTLGAPSSVRASADLGWASAKPTVIASPPLPFTQQTATTPRAAIRPIEDLWHLRATHIALPPRAIDIFATLYAVILLCSILRLARGYLSAHKLLTASTVYTLTEAESVLWHDLTQSLEVGLPTLRSSSQLSSPVVVGILHPTLLLPANFRACPSPQQRAAIAHELAHVQRRDTLIHALCQLAALPLVWHPVLHAVDRRIARTREMICDLVAARQMRSEVHYARCLLALAQSMLSAGNPAPAVGLGLFRNNKLEERVMQLTAIKPTLTRSQTLVRRTAGAAILASAIAAAALFHLAPVLAQSVPPTPPILQTAPAQPPAPPVAPDLSQTAPAAPPATTPPPAADVPSAPTLPGVQTAAPAAPQAPTPAPTPAPPAPPALVSTPGFVIDDADFNIAHGKNGHVIVKDGQHVHHWIGQDGQPFEIVNDQAADLTPDQQRAAEAEYRLMIAKAQKEIAAAKAQINSPEFKAQINKITSGEIDRQMAQAQKQLAAAKAQLNSPEFKADMDKITSGEVAKEMERARIELDQQIATLKSDEWSANAKKQIDEAVAQLNNGELEKQLADAQHQLQFVSSPEFDKQMKDAEKRLQDAQKLMQKNSSLSHEEQQRRLDEANQRLQEATRALAEARKNLQPSPQ
jgi:beta-lactamase regulating signal transducer with metallopeptidase domain